jgi:hypothetical protein
MTAALLFVVDKQGTSFYLCSMLIHGTPIAADLPSDPTFKDRFWYWTGASGRKYIHSVYALEDCPPLPGAIFIGVRREGPLRIVMGIGRFTQFWDGAFGSSDLADLRRSGADEIHVHLLAKSPEVAKAILEDLLQAYEHEEPGFSEPAAVLSQTGASAAAG